MKPPQPLPTKCVKEGEPVRLYPGRYGLQDLCVGEYRFIPIAFLTHLKNPIGAVCNACYAFAKRRNLPKGAFSCVSRPDGIFIYRDK